MGTDTIMFHSGAAQSAPFTVAKPPAAVSGHGAIGTDGLRHLLSDHFGNLR